jgi:glutamine phosphoribosylpyrophosphate amidotransferase
LGLYALQHRGQESAGIVAIDDNGQLTSVRNMGLVSDVFEEPDLRKLDGSVAVGHTRYSTAGSSVLANAQPIIADIRGGPLVLSHNGNLTNAAAIRRELVAEGAIFQSSADSEVIVHLIAKSTAPTPEGRFDAHRELTYLEDRHRSLKQQVANLDRRAILTPDEQRTAIDLKKQKLATKDAISALRSKYRD